MELSREFGAGPIARRDEQSQLRLPPQQIDSRLQRAQITSSRLAGFIQFRQFGAEAIAPRCLAGRMKIHGGLSQPPQDIGAFRQGLLCANALQAGRVFPHHFSHLLLVERGTAARAVPGPAAARSAVATNAVHTRRASTRGHPRRAAATDRATSRPVPGPEPSRAAAAAPVLRSCSRSPAQSPASTRRPAPSDGSRRRPRPRRDAFIKTGRARLLPSRDLPSRDLPHLRLGRSRLGRASPSRTTAWKLLRASSPPGVALRRGPSRCSLRPRCRGLNGRVICR